jgi:hypothetical protein
MSPQIKVIPSVFPFVLILEDNLDSLEQAKGSETEAGKQPIWPAPQESLAGFSSACGNRSVFSSASGLPGGEQAIFPLTFQ